MNPEFRDFGLRLVEPRFNSRLTDLVMQLQYLKRYRLHGETPPFIFFQLKEIFHILESLASARIEGNRTTIAEIVDDQISPPAERSQDKLELQNIQEAMAFIDEVIVPQGGITKAFIFQLHKMVVRNLTVEGDTRPGQFRQRAVAISGSEHRPPDFLQVEPYMNELIAFMNDEYDHKNDLLRTALVHHRFAWIHPFANGNGRVVRLITYAMLIDRGFRGLNIQEGRILNPSAMFCNQRDRYYAMLTRADSGTDEGLLEWCEFVLDGFLSEMTKIDRLLDYDYLVSNVLKPALDYCRERKLITDEEHRVLVIAARKKAFKSADVEDAYPGSSEKRSRFIARLKEKGFLMPLQEGGRIYYLRLRGELLRGIIYSLEKEGFVPFERTQ